MLNTVEAILSEDGKLNFHEKIELKKSVRVLVTFMDAEIPIQAPKKFQFQKARNILNKYNMNLSGAIIEERRNSI